MYDPKPARWSIAGEGDIIEFEQRESFQSTMYKTHGIRNAIRDAQEALKEAVSSELPRRTYIRRK
jgi:hypothetical protein